MKKTAVKKPAKKAVRKTSKPAPRRVKAVEQIDLATYQLPADHVLCLRTNNSDLTSYGGFQWPASGECSAPDWNSKKSCGEGLHGLLWGMGDPDLLNWDESAKWMAVEVPASSIVDLEGKVKFPRCRIVFCGDRLGATSVVAKFAPNGTAVIGGTATAGDFGTATAGNRGTATAGNSGTATAGNRGTATAGNSGTATAGNFGTATAGNFGTATAGNFGTATAGNRGTATAGDRGTIQLSYYDKRADRKRIVTKYVGEDGIKPNTPYTIDEKGVISEVKRPKDSAAKSQ